MAKQSISLGSSANDGTGTTLRAGGDLINDNFNEIYNLIGDGTDLSLTGLTLPTATLSGNATITSIVSSSAFTIDAANNINLDSDTGQIIIKDGGTTIASLLNSSTDFIIETATSDKDIIFKVNDGGSSTEVMRIDGDVPAVLLPQNVEMRFTDSQESIKSDGSNLILKSGNQAYTIPATDGSADQFLKTNGSGVLSFATVNTTTAFDDVTAGDAAVNVTTTAGNITIDAQGSDTDIIFKGTDGSSDITPMTIDMSDAGALLLTGGKIDLKNSGAQSVIRFYCESSNAHYAEIKAPAHSDFSGDITLTLPATTDTLVGKTTTDTLTNKTLTSPALNTATVGTSISHADNVKALFGTGNDLEIFHDGSNSNISDVGTGKLVLRTDGTGVDINKGSSENIAKFIVDGAVELYHDNSKKLETTSTGVEVTGGVRSPSGSDLTIGRTGGALMVAGGDAFVPTSDDAFDLGSASAQWRDIYTGDINLNNTKTRDNEVDGTRGSWTIQEGADDLFLLNRLNGKKYKFKLEEIL